MNKEQKFGALVLAIEGYREQAEEMTIDSDELYARIQEDIKRIKRMR